MELLDSRALCVAAGLGPGFSRSVDGLLTNNLSAEAERGFEYAFGYLEMARLRHLNDAEVTLSSAGARRNSHRDIVARPVGHRSDIEPSGGHVRNGLYLILLADLRGKLDLGCTVDLYHQPGMS
jgi:hypothetical protein